MKDVYSQWIQQMNISGLTNTQSVFAKFMLENHKKFAVIGDIDSVFISIRKFIKDNPQLFNQQKEQNNG